MRWNGVGVTDAFGHHIREVGGEEPVIKVCLQTRTVFDEDDDTDKR